MLGFASLFKKQMVQIYENGKTRAAIVEEYDLTASALDRWSKQAQATGSFKEKDNRSSGESFTRIEKPTPHARSK
ncbi:hypothetical protein [Paenibacillus sp. NPDC055715]